jgi:pantoate--beta-alanine ligase
MRVVRVPEEMRAMAEDVRRDGKRIGVVTTMGFLHEGHVSLLRIARARCDFLIMTLFVNPAQFGPNEDLDRYPRDEEGDLKRAREAGTDVVFAPEAASIYPRGYQTTVDVPELSKPLCGVSRPHFFGGVATVLTKLFTLTMPHLVVFGEKDYQQLLLVRRLVRDLDMGIEVLGGPIVREPDGLARSSRNVYLSPAEREQALCLPRALAAARALYEAGEHDGGRLVAAARRVIEAAPLARPEYVELRDAETLEPVARVERATLLALAVHIGKTRLIDNTVLGR